MSVQVSVNELLNRLAIDLDDKQSPIAVTGRISDWVKKGQGRLPVSCTTYVVQDSMEGPASIEDSWIFCSKALRGGAGVAIHLGNLRPKGAENSHGLVASGPVSFAQIYSKLNEILRRGGAYRNGAVNCHLPYTHPDAREFVTAPRELLPWVKRTLTVDEGFLEWEGLEDALQAVRRGDLWLTKSAGESLTYNVCVSGDTLVMTSEGPKPAKELVGVPFQALVDGELHPSTDRGFWSNGFRQVVDVVTKEGFTVRVTPDHKLHTPQGWIQAGDLNSGDKVSLNDHSHSFNLAWSGNGDYDQGWLLGWLLGDGTYTNEAGAKLDFYGSKAALLDSTLQKLQKLDHLLDSDNGYSDRRTGGRSASADRVSVSSRGLARLAEQFSITRSHKKATELLDCTSSEFHRGFIQAYFDADGTVNLGQASGSGKSLAVTSINLCNLQLLQRMLLRFGIRSRIWKHRYNGKLTKLPDGKGGTKEYTTKAASRLDISGQIDIRRFSALIGFSLPEKQEKLETLLASYGTKAPYKKAFEATVEAVIPAGVEEVFDCTIEDAHCFDANGLVAHNCLEIAIPHTGTCLLSHVNLGACEVGDIPEAMRKGMEFLCELHAQTGIDTTNFYLSPEEDRQVGLGLLGLSNLLAIENVRYVELVEALEQLLGINTGTNTLNLDAVAIARALKAGYETAAKVARSFGMERSFTIAPCASVAYRYEDREGWTCSPEISAPIDTQVDRDSATLGVSSYDHHPNSEVAEDVGFDVHFRLNACIQTLMERTGLAHSISFNVWSDVAVIDRGLVERWLESPLKSWYYSLQVMRGTQTKDDALAALEDYENFDQVFTFAPLGAEMRKVEEPLNIPCIGCAE